MNVTLSQQATPTDEVLFQEVAGEAVLLNLATEKYFGLDPVGTRFWILLGENPSLQHAFSTMSEEYEVAPERLREDLLELAGKLAQAGLVTIR
jgi:hypothetical protein